MLAQIVPSPVDAVPAVSAHQIPMGRIALKIFLRHVVGHVRAARLQVRVRLRYQPAGRVKLGEQTAQRAIIFQKRVGFVVFYPAVPLRQNLRVGLNVVVKVFKGLVKGVRVVGDGRKKEAAHRLIGRPVRAGGPRARGGRGGGGRGRVKTKSSRLNPWYFIQENDCFTTGTPEFRLWCPSCIV